MQLNVYGLSRYITAQPCALPLLLSGVHVANWCTIERFRKKIIEAFEILSGDLCSLKISLQNLKKRGATPSDYTLTN